MPRKAKVTHHMPSRFRVRISSRKGDADFFRKVQEQLGQCSQVTGVEGNPVTGSILVTHTGEMKDVLQYAAEKGLFSLVEKEFRKGIALATLATYKVLDDEIKKLSGGQLDLAHTAFLTFIGTGVYQLARGRIGLPTWHNAFWYAFNVFLKTQTVQKHQYHPQLSD